jgi:hypothetical protein
MGMEYGQDYFDDILFTNMSSSKNMSYIMYTYQIVTIHIQKITISNY